MLIPYPFIILQIICDVCRIYNFISITETATLVLIFISFNESLTYITTLKIRQTH